MEDCFAEELNRYGRERKPALFIIDFEMKRPIVMPPDEICRDEILFDVGGRSNAEPGGEFKGNVVLDKYPVSGGEYEKAFDKIMEEFRKGNSFLLNLTFPTTITINLDLKDIFRYSKAKYKLYYKDIFTVFSPETFIRTAGNKIYSYPMKGTIDASVPDAENIIMNDEKEFAEHITIVDLIRNDLGIVSSKVDVEKFRYIDRVKTCHGELMQVSSVISGCLDPGWQPGLGDIITALLPAGSVTGAPKKKTVEIIKSVENYDRGYYTGIFGYFDGTDVDCGVMIRFVEKKDGKFVFKSGGGLTIYSDVKKEYGELLEKVYVPVY